MTLGLRASVVGDISSRTLGSEQALQICCLDTLKQFSFSQTQISGMRIVSFLSISFLPKE